YALACLRLFMFLPLTQMIALQPTKTSQLADEIAKLFPAVPDQFLADAVRVITDARGASTSSNGRAASLPPLEPNPSGWILARESMAQAIVSAATPERADRLFPGDPKQFETSCLNLAYGAAGVLYALEVTGAGRYPEYEQWLIERAMNPPPGTRIGFYDGLHGVAYTLERLGRRSEALALLDICTDELDADPSTMIVRSSRALTCKTSRSQRSCWSSLLVGMRGAFRARGWPGGRETRPRVGTGRPGAVRRRPWSSPVRSWLPWRAAERARCWCSAGRGRRCRR
ncbi:MAG: hypothetical protein LC777_01550, partial [Actinobacteria bacterium]|nr:hypothetical protein [Actinomycetota bacterium]